MVTYIGGSSPTDYVSDHATPASATYCWNLQGAQVRLQQPDPPLSYLQMESGQTFATLGYKIAHIATISYNIKNSTDYQNFIKAVGYWRKNSSTLYLNVENEWNINLAQYADYSSPTTLTDWTGFLRDLTYSRGANIVEVRAKFVLATNLT